MVTHLFMHNKRWQQIFKWPVVMGLLTLFGLITALIEDGGHWEHLAILSLCIPVLVIIYFYWIKKLLN